MVTKLVDTSPVVENVSTSVTESEPMVHITLPLLEVDETGAKVDQTEHVTINGETTIIKRGEYVSVKVPVFLALKVKYPNL